MDLLKKKTAAQGWITKLTKGHRTEAAASISLTSTGARSLLC